MQTACECIWQASGKADRKTSKRRHPGTEVRFIACPTAILVAQLRGEGAVAWNRSHDWEWEWGGRRKGFPRPLSLPRPPQNLILYSVFCLSLAPLPDQVLRSDAEVCTLGWVHSTGLHKPQHHGACLPLGSTAPAACCLQAPKNPPPSPQ